jgi:serine/threonine protein kinase/Flp pilus assembly protein TadD
MDIDFAKARDIFMAAAEKGDRSERIAFLDNACGSNEELRRHVDLLLSAHGQSGSFLDKGAVANHTVDLPLAEKSGTVIGPYKLLQQIGEGGMGVVYMAEQTEPIQRTVALKIIKAGMDTLQVMARFEAERQALAMMDHPNIAKVHDAGATENGRPYFVMELVKGVPITKYCDEKHLSIRQRLELFRPVCEAVQHAHQKGIIHRDIKPTNVLVAEYDNHAAPKVIDFGVAKATAQKLTERTLFTEFGQVVGTVEYMSPEQAKLNQLDIDTRSDIYSLGVLLYELLTGSTPFEQKHLREAAFDEVLRIIREEEPPKPSTKLSSSDKLPSIAANRHTEPARLTKDVRGELDWIVMKALDKDRNRRYETASGLAHDLERYLTDQPVQAGPPSLGYKLRKLVKRNKRGVAIGAVLGVVIAGAIAATAGSIGWAVRDKKARETVVESRIQHYLEQAELELNRGQLVYAMRDLEQAASVMDTSEPRPAVGNRLHEDAKRWGRMKLESDVAENYVRMALFDESEAHFVQAEAKFRKAVRQLPENSLTNAFLARNLALQGKLIEGEHFGREAVRLDPDEAWAHHCLACVLVRQEKFAEAVVHYRADLQHQKEWGEYRSSDKFDDQVAHARIENQVHSDRGQSHIELAWALRRVGKTAEAELEFQEARHDKFLASPAYAGGYLAGQGRLPEAAAHYLEATRANPEDSETALRAACLQLAIGDREQYEALCQQMLDRFGQTVDSAVAYRVCFACLLSPEPVGDLQQLRRLSNAGDGVPSHLVYRARALVAYRTGNWEEALQLSRTGRKDAAPIGWKFYDMHNLVLEAMALHHLGRSDEASKAYEESTNVAREFFPRAPIYLHKSTVGDAWTEWVLYEPLRREAEALVPQSTALLLLELANGPAGVRRAISEARSLSWDKLAPRDLLVCGELLLLGGNFERASEAFAEAIGRGGKDSSYYTSLGWALLRAGKKEEAVAALSTALEGLDHDQLAAKGEPHHWTAAYLLGRVSENDYIQHWRQHPIYGSRIQSLPWFYIGQKAEADGNVQRAASAYRSSVETGADNWQGDIADELLMAGVGFISDISGTWAAYRLTELPGGQQPAAKQPEPEDPLAQLRRHDEKLDRYKARWSYFLLDDVLGYNSRAWPLATAAAPEARNPARAVELATRAVELAPAYGEAWNTLGVAQYRAGDWNSAIKAFEKSMDLRDGGNAFDWFFLAMAHWQLGQKDEARKWYDQAVEWTNKNQPKNEELQRFRAEAAELLGIIQPQPAAEETKPTSDNGQETTDD